MRFKFEQAMTHSTPWENCVTPMPHRVMVCFDDANKRAAARMSPAARPVARETASGAYFFCEISAAYSSKPVVWALIKSWSTRSDVTMTWAMALRNSMLVPPLMGR